LFLVLFWKVAMSFPTCFKLVTALALVATLTACGKNASPSNEASIRLINLGVDTGSVNATYKDGNNNPAIATGVANQAASAYVKVQSGTRDFTITNTTGGATIATRNGVQFNGGPKYSILLFGTAANAQTAFIQDDAFTQPTSGNFRVRVIMSAIGLNAVDVYITAPNADLATVSPNFSNVGASQVTTADIAAGTYQIRATTANAKTVVYDGGTVNFASLDLATLVLYTRGSSTLANGVLLRNDSAGTTTFMPNNIGRYRFVQGNSAYAGSNGINVFVNNARVLSNVVFQQTPDYLTGGTAARTLRLEATATPGTAVVPDQQLTLAPSQESTILLTGSSVSSLRTFIYSDNTLPSTTAGNARVRFVHGSLGAAPFDIYSQSQPVATNIAVGTTTSYLELAAAATSGTVYTFASNTAGGGELSRTTVTLLPNKVYTVFILGLPATPSYFVTTDN
jgi:Domain of unknown function (DUF4397)